MKKKWNVRGRQKVIIIIIIKGRNRARGSKRWGGVICLARVATVVDVCSHLWVMCRNVGLYKNTTLFFILRFP